MSAVVAGETVTSTVRLVPSAPAVTWPATMSVVSTGEVAPRPKVTLDDAFRPVPKIVRGAETAPAPITVGDTVTDPVETTVTAFGIVFVPPSRLVISRPRVPPSAVAGTTTLNVIEYWSPTAADPGTAATSALPWPVAGNTLTVVPLPKFAPLNASITVDEPLTGGLR